MLASGRAAGAAGLPTCSLHVLQHRGHDALRLPVLQRRTQRGRRIRNLGLFFILGLLIYAFQLDEADEHGPQYRQNRNQRQAAPGLLVDLPYGQHLHRVDGRYHENQVEILGDLLDGLAVAER